MEMFVELSGRLGWAVILLLLSGCIRTGYREASTDSTMVDGESFTTERRSYKTLQSVDEIRIGGPDWGKGATIFVDEIAIVY